MYLLFSRWFIMRYLSDAFRMPFGCLYMSIVEDSSRRVYKCLNAVRNESTIPQDLTLVEVWPSLLTPNSDEHLPFSLVW